MDAGPKLVQDVVPGGGRSVRDIPIPPGRRRPNDLPKVSLDRTRHFDATSFGATKGGMSRYGLWILAAVAVLALFGAGFLLFASGARVEVTAKQASASPQGTFTARKEGAVSSELPYSVLTVTKAGSRPVTPTGEETVAERASGTIIVYNAYSTTPQKLIANTRFEAPNGKVYRIKNAITVPGGKKEGNAITTPGSLEVTVYADQPGTDYNIGMVDFTVPGLKGTSQYDTIYARSKSDMSGGFVGTRPIVSPSDLSAAKTAIEAELSEALRSDAKAQVPEDSILFDSGTFFSYELAPTTENQDGTVSVNETGTLRAVVVSKGDLGAFIANTAVAGYDGSPVSVTNPESLSFTVLNRDIAKPWEESTFEFSLSGSANLRWTYSPEALATDLAGKEKGALTTVLSGYPGIDRARASIRPFWRGKFPEDPADVAIIDVASTEAR